MGWYAIFSKHLVDGVKVDLLSELIRNKQMTEKTFSFDHPAVTLLNSFQMVLTASIRLHNQRLLEVVVAEALVGEKKKRFGPISEVQDLKIKPQSRKFGFKFLSFVSYSVTEEMFWHSRGEIAKYNGWVRQLTHSPFLTFIDSSTWANEYTNDDLFHFQLITLDHTIDVATTKLPEFFPPTI